MLTHRSVQASAAAGLILVLCNIVTTLSLWLWAIWAALTVAGISQAHRARDTHPIQ